MQERQLQELLPQPQALPLFAQPHVLHRQRQQLQPQVLAQPLVVVVLVPATVPVVVPELLRQQGLQQVWPTNVGNTIPPYTP